MLNILDIGDRYGYPVASIFEPFIQKGLMRVISEWTDEEEPDLIMFGGGADVNPDLYGHINLCSGTSPSSIQRDKYETRAYNTAVQQRIPMIGICRGAQFLNVMCGGKMIQDVKNHGGEHMIKDVVTKEILPMTSTHHQMMYPWSSDFSFLILAEASPARSRGYYKFAGVEEMMLDELDCEPEIVFFERQRCLCVQGHPEYYSPNHPSVKYIRKLVNSYLLKQPLGEF